MNRLISVEQLDIIIDALPPSAQRLMVERLAKPCDGQHGGPRCHDLHCWNDTLPDRRTGDSSVMYEQGWNGACDKWEPLYRALQERLEHSEKSATHNLSALQGFLGASPEMGWFEIGEEVERLSVQSVQMKNMDKALTTLAKLFAAFPKNAVTTWQGVAVEAEKVIKENSDLRLQLGGMRMDLDAANARNPLAVWFGQMPESNGKTNHTVIIHKGDITEGITVHRSEYNGRAQYEADYWSWLLGDGSEKPWLHHYDTDTHSGYKPKEEVKAPNITPLFDGISVQRDPILPKKMMIVSPDVFDLLRDKLPAVSEACLTCKGSGKEYDSGAAHTCTECNGTGLRNKG